MRYTFPQNRPHRTAVGQPARDDRLRQGRGHRRSRPSSPNQGIVAGTLAVSAARPNLTLRNTTESVVGYIVVDKDMAVIATFPPCISQCPTLVQGASATVPYTSISGYKTTSTEAIVMWWTYIRAADGTLQPTGGVQSTKVTL